MKGANLTQHVSFFPKGHTELNRESTVVGGDLAAVGTAVEKREAAEVSYLRDAIEQSELGAIAARSCGVYLR